MIVSDARTFQSTLKMQISDHPLSISIYGLARIFQHAPHDFTYTKLK